MKIEFTFRDLPLAIGVNCKGRRQIIAAISGTAMIEYRTVILDDGNLEFEWEIVSARLAVPGGDGGVTIEWIPSLSPLMDWIAESIEHQHGSVINTAVRQDAAVRDPDIRCIEAGGAADRWCHV